MGGPRITDIAGSMAAWMQNTAGSVVSSVATKRVAPLFDGAKLMKVQLVVLVVVAAEAVVEAAVPVHALDVLVPVRAPEAEDNKIKNEK